MRGAVLREIVVAVGKCERHAVQLVGLNQRGSLRPPVRDNAMQFTYFQVADASMTPMATTLV
jgi:hypothetical protein